MDMGRVLVIYKKSQHQIHIAERKDPHLLRLRRAKHPYIKRMERADRAHRRTLEHVEEALDREGLRYRLLFRAEFADEKGYDLIITVGGDGTLLLASHHIRTKPVLAVSSGGGSVGYLCSTGRSGFRELLRQVLAGKARELALHRLRAKVGSKDVGVPVLNEILFATSNPAATSRYSLRVGGREEEQKSSGIWIAPAAGSTAAIKSAGGKVLPVGSARFQYVVRELYEEDRPRYRLKKGVLGPRASVTIRSRMRHGKIYLDGHHLCWPVPYAETVTVSGGAPPLRIYGKLRSVKGR